VRIATWNVNSLNVRMGRVEEWLAEVQPDVVCMQETKLADSKFPALAFQGLGYESAHRGQGQWNGVAILSRVGLDDVVYDFDDGDEDDPEARLITATCAGIKVSSVYVPNGRSLDDDHYRYKLAWLERLTGMLERSDPLEPRIVCGDFNIAPDDIDVYDPSKFVGSTHTSEAERAALKRMTAWGLSDVFRAHYPNDQVFSWWDYRAGDFHQGRGMRIDLMLASASVAARVKWAVIDRNARKGKQPSDHAPVLLDLD
jgi:exodeoxyribonuclease III